MNRKTSKNNLSSLCVLCYYGFFLPFLLPSQNAVTVFHYANSPLPNNTVRCLAIDPLTDEVWIGTDAGLAVFDGMNWMVYTTSNSPLTDNYIKAIYIDDQNYKWIGTVNGGVFRFDGTGWININSSAGLSSNYVRAVAKDTAGAMWFGTSGGLNKFDGVSWTCYTVLNTGLFSDHITTLKIMENNTKVFGTLNGGMAYLDDDTMIIYDHWTNTLPENTVLDIELDTSGNRWACMPSAGVTTHYGGSTWTWFAAANSAIPTDAVADCFVEKSSNKKYFATQDFGMLEYDDAGNFIVYDSASAGFPENFLNCLVQDAAGIFWIGTADSGLVRFDKQQWIGIKKNDAENYFTCFPNPAQDRLSIYCPAGVSKLSLSDFTGKLLIDQSLPGEKYHSLITSHLAGGIYFLTLRAATGSISRVRIVIEH